jgi:hypothetical protein
MILFLFLLLFFAVYLIFHPLPVVPVAIEEPQTWNDADTYAKKTPFKGANHPNIYLGKTGLASWVQTIQK